jgi:flagellar protein FliS
VQIHASRGHAAYRSAEVGSANPVRIIALLYEGAIRFLRQAQASEDPIARSQLAGRAHRIVAELLSALDREQGGEIAANLGAIYQFVLGEITTANQKGDRGRLGRTARILDPLGAAWRELASRPQPAP